MTPPVVVAYFTNEEYRQEAERLRASLGELCLSYHFASIRTIPDDWDTAVRYKPRFLAEAFAVIGKRDLLYVDADAVFRSVPDWEILRDCDFACHVFKRTELAPEEFLTGTLYLRYSPRIWGFLEEWISLTDSIGASDTPEQDALKVLLGRNKSVRFQSLPPEWCWIFDDMRKLYPDRRPVIEHFQASRRYRFKGRTGRGTKPR